MILEDPEAAWQVIKLRHMALLVWLCFQLTVQPLARPPCSSLPHVNGVSLLVCTQLSLESKPPIQSWSATVGLA